MESTTRLTPAPLADVPTTPASLTRGLIRAGLGATVATGLVTAGVVAASGRTDWWPAFLAASVIAAGGAAVSVAILSMAAGRTVDWLVTIVMAASAARLGVGLAGLLIAVSGLHTPAEPTGFMICAYFAVLLVVETTLSARATLTAGGRDVSGQATSVVGGRNV